jgi:DNA gyrase inhibitor GyrI
MRNRYGVYCGSDLSQLDRHQVRNLSQGRFPTIALIERTRNHPCHEIRVERLSNRLVVRLDDKCRAEIRRDIPGRSFRCQQFTTKEMLVKGTMNYHITIRETPAIKVAAVPHRGDYKQIATTFEQLAAVAANMNLFGPTTRSFGVYYDDPLTAAPDALRSDACLTVPEDWSASGQLQMREIRGGRYAVTLQVGPYTELAHAYKWVYGTWLPQSEELANAPIVEEYLNDARTVPRMI